MQFGGDTGIDADFVKELAETLTNVYATGGLSCSYCESENITPLYYFTELTNHGFMVAIKCNDCGKTSDDGDGEFFDYYRVVDGSLLPR